MTRKSRREIERALEDMGTDPAAGPSPAMLSEAEKQDIRTALRYRREVGAAPTATGLDRGDLRRLITAARERAKPGKLETSDIGAAAERLGLAPDGGDA